MADIRTLVEKIENAIGPDATAAQVESIARLFLDEIVSSRSAGPPAVPPSRSADGDRVIITAYGHDKPGILAAITNVVSKEGCNILDVSQKILQGYFTLIMLADVATSHDSASDLQNELARAADQLQVRIMVQHEELFNAMQRP